MTDILVTTRDITTTECPWLNTDIPKGTAVWRYDGSTYGCVSSSGIAVSAKPAETPFFEVPADAVTKGNA